METTSQEKFDKIVEDFEKDLTTSYLYYNQFNGALSHAMRNSNISWSKLDEEIIDAFKYAICNSFHGGCEPEFETEEAYSKWENFNMSAFELVTESQLKEATLKNQKHNWYRNADEVKLNSNHLSPFIDKSTPYYVLVNGDYGDAFEKTKL
jgi:hypothetical protein